MTALAGERTSDAVRVLDGDGEVELAIVASGGTARAVIWPGIGIQLRSVARIELDPGGATIEMRHPGEAVYYVKSGGGEVADGTRNETDDLVEGSMIHIEPGTPYRFRADARGMELLGGPAPADPALYKRIDGPV